MGVYSRWEKNKDKYPHECKGLYPDCPSSDQPLPQQRCLSCPIRYEHKAREVHLLIIDPRGSYTPDRHLLFTRVRDANSMARFIGLEPDEVVRK